MYYLSRRSWGRLRTCHEYLQTLLREAVGSSPVDFMVIEGHRTKEKQDAAYRAGKSGLQWPRSKHNQTPSLAVDIAPYVDGKASWDWDHYHPLADHLKETWGRLKDEGKVEGDLIWGGDWKSFQDGPHWELRNLPARSQSDAE